MPWNETSPVDQRERFIADVRAGLFTMTELCERYGVSRTAGYKWVARADAGGRAALADRSRAPYHCPHRISTALAELFCTARRAHPLWGPKKLVQFLVSRHRRITTWPAVSTVGDVVVRPPPHFPVRHQDRLGRAGHDVFHQVRILGTLVHQLPRDQIHRAHSLGEPVAAHHLTI